MVRVYLWPTKQSVTEEEDKVTTWQPYKLFINCWSLYNPKQVYYKVELHVQGICLDVLAHKKHEVKNNIYKYYTLF